MQTRLYRRLNKTAAAALCAVLVASSSHLAEAAAIAPAARPEAAPSIFSLLPPQIGHLSDHYDAPSKNGKFVVLIQDLHTNYGVQKNIAALLNFLADHLKTKAAPDSLPYALAVEGAEGPVDSSALSLFPDARVKERAADYLMRQGELSGAEYFGVMRGLPAAATGVEDKRFYELHRDLFRRTYDDRRQMVEILKGIQVDVQALAKRSYSRPVRAIQRLGRAVEEGQLSEAEYVDALIHESDARGLAWEKLFPELRDLRAARGSESSLERAVSEAQELQFQLALFSAEKSSEKDLIQVEHDLALLVRIANVQATELEVKSFGPRLNEFVALCHSLMVSNGVRSFDERRVRELMSTSIDYYAMALARNKPMVDHTLALMQKQSRPAVLVVGGFHTDAIAALLRQRGVSYAVLTPFIENVSDEADALYVKRLNGEVLSAEDVLSDAQALAPSTLVKNAPGAAPNGLQTGLNIAKPPVIIMALFAIGWALGQHVDAQSAHAFVASFIDTKWGHLPLVHNALVHLPLLVGAKAAAPLAAIAMARPFSVAEEKTNRQFQLVRWALKNKLETSLHEGFMDLPPFVDINSLRHYLHRFVLIGTLGTRIGPLADTQLDQILLDVENRLLERNINPVSEPKKFIVELIQAIGVESRMPDFTEKEKRKMVAMGIVAVELSRLRDVTSWNHDYATRTYWENVFHSQGADAYLTDEVFEEFTDAYDAASQTFPAPAQFATNIFLRLGPTLNPRAYLFNGSPFGFLRRRSAAIVFTLVSAWAAVFGPAQRRVQAQGVTLVQVPPPRAHPTAAQLTTFSHFSADQQLITQNAGVAFERLIQDANMAEDVAILDKTIAYIFDNKKPWLDNVKGVIITDNISATAVTVLKPNGSGYILIKRSALSSNASSSPSWTLLRILAHQGTLNLNARKGYSDDRAEALALREEADAMEMAGTPADDVDQKRLRADLRFDAPKPAALQTRAEMEVESSLLALAKEALKAAGVDVGPLRYKSVLHQPSNGFDIFFGDNKNHSYKVAIRPGIPAQVFNISPGALTAPVTYFCGSVISWVLYYYYRWTNQIDKAEVVGRQGSPERKKWIEEPFTTNFENLFFAFSGALFVSLLHSPLDTALSAARLRRAVRLQRIVRGRFFQTLKGLWKTKLYDGPVSGWALAVGAGAMTVEVFQLSFLRPVFAPLDKIWFAYAAALDAQKKWHLAWNKRHPDDGGRLMAGSQKEINKREPFSATLPNQTRGGLNQDRSFGFALPGGVQVAAVFHGAHGLPNGDEGSEEIAGWVRSDLERMDLTVPEEELRFKIEATFAIAQERLKENHNDNRVVSGALLIVRPSKTNDKEIEAFSFNVGNARTYAVPEKSFAQVLTVDSGAGGFLHNLSEVNSTLTITEQPFLSSVQEEAELKTGRNKILFKRRQDVSVAFRAASDAPNLEQTGSYVRMPVGTRFLVVSAGIHLNLTDREISKVAKTNPASEVAQSLVRTARARSQQKEHLRARDSDLTALVILTDGRFSHAGSGLGNVGPREGSLAGHGRIENTPGEFLEIPIHGAYGAGLPSTNEKTVGQPLSPAETAAWAAAREEIQSFAATGVMPLDLYHPDYFRLVVEQKGIRNLSAASFFQIRRRIYDILNAELHKKSWQSFTPEQTQQFVKNVLPKLPLGENNVTPAKVFYSFWGAINHLNFGQAVRGLFGIVFNSAYAFFAGDEAKRVEFNRIAAKAATLLANDGTPLHYEPMNGSLLKKLFCFGEAEPENSVARVNLMLSPDMQLRTLIHEGLHLLHSEWTESQVVATTDEYMRRYYENKRRLSETVSQANGSRLKAKKKADLTDLLSLLPLLSRERHLSPQDTFSISEATAALLRSA